VILVGKFKELNGRAVFPIMHVANVVVLAHALGEEIMKRGNAPKER
jgi:hypothetical protein